MMIEKARESTHRNRVFRSRFGLWLSAHDASLSKLKNRNNHVLGHLRRHRMRQTTSSCFRRLRAVKHSASTNRSRSSCDGARAPSPCSWSSLSFIHIGSDLANWKPGGATAILPTMTNSSVGSNKVDEMVRNDATLAGRVIPPMNSPHPKENPLKTSKT